jgi:hypothetical protein
MARLVKKATKANGTYRRVVDTSHTYRRVNPDDVAAALGAEPLTNPPPASRPR